MSEIEIEKQVQKKGSPKSTPKKKNKTDEGSTSNSSKQRAGEHVEQQTTPKSSPSKRLRTSNDKNSSNNKRKSVTIVLEDNNENNSNNNNSNSNTNEEDKVNNQKENKKDNTSSDKNKKSKQEDKENIQTDKSTQEQHTQTADSVEDSISDEHEQFFTPTATPPINSSIKFSPTVSNTWTEEEERQKERDRQERFGRDGGRRGAFYAGTKPPEKKIGLNPNEDIEEAPNSHSGLVNSPSGKTGKIKSRSLRLHCGYAETMGKRPTMEDDFVFIGQFNGNAKMDLVGLFDGHRGKAASKYAAKELSNTITVHMSKYENDSRELLKQSFLTINQGMKDSSVKAGTTALVGFFTEKKAYIANAGDSRAVLCRGTTAIRLTKDHRPDSIEEIDRITKLGGEITTIVTKEGKVISRVGGLLGVSRSMGDFDLEPYVTAEPEVHEFDFDVNNSNQFIILACDGLWEVIDDQEAVDIALPILQKSDAEEASKRLRDVAYARGSTDNITVIVLKFMPVTETAAAVDDKEGSNNNANGSSGKSKKSKDKGGSESKRSSKESKGKDSKENSKEDSDEEQNQKKEEENQEPKSKRRSERQSTGKDINGKKPPNWPGCMII